MTSPSLSREDFEALKKGEHFGWNTVDGKFEFFLAMAANTYEDYIKSVREPWQQESFVSESRLSQFSYQLYNRGGRHTLHMPRRPTRKEKLMIWLKRAFYCRGNPSRPSKHEYWVRPTFRDIEFDFKKWHRPASLKPG